MFSCWEDVPKPGPRKRTAIKTGVPFATLWPGGAGGGANGSVAFDFENEREIIRVRKELDPAQQKTLAGMKPQQRNLEEWEEVWTGDFIFENEWQSFRTKKDRSLEFTSAAKEVDKKRVKIAVKVVDIFRNDTMTIIDVSLKR